MAAKASQGSRRELQKSPLVVDTVGLSSREMSKHLKLEERTKLFEQAQS